MKAPVLSLIVLLPALLIGVIFWFSARTRRGVLFGVSVPLDFASSPEARCITTNHRARILLFMSATALACGLAAMRDLPWLIATATPVGVIAGFASWQFARRRVKAHEIAAPLTRRASLSDDAGASPAWFAVIALAVLPLGATWFYLRRHWSELPARFPTHWNVNAVADRWATLSAGSVATPLVIGAAIILFLVFVAAFMRLTPMTDRQRASRVMFPTLGALSWSLSAIFCWVALMPLRPSFGSTGLVIVVLTHLLVVMTVMARLIFQLMHTQGREAYDGTPDTAWRAGGLVYYNPSDAAVMVPQRLGWGWTLNFGRPAAWCYCGVVVLLITGIGVVPFLLK